MDELSPLHLGHTPIGYDAVTGTGRDRIPFAQVPLDRATAYAAEDADVALRLWQALRPRLRRTKALALYEQMERRLMPILLAHGARRRQVDADELRRMSVDFADAHGGDGDRTSTARRPEPSTSAAPSSWARCCSTR